MAKARISTPFNHHSVTGIRFTESMQDNEFNHYFRASWEIDIESLDDAYDLIKEKFDITYYEDQEHKHDYLLELPEIVALVTLVSKNFFIYAWAKNKAPFNSLKNKFLEIFPEVPEPVNDSVKLSFWYNTNNGPQHTNRILSVPDWEDMAHNYTASTFEPLNDLLTRFRPTAGGKLILWQGEPGTGKSYALRALIKNWRNWCSAEYILDPEALFGYSPGYLVQLLLSSYVDEYEEEDEDLTQTDKKWRLLILEDTGELLSENAKERAGQGLSRLLNLVDGLIGQGLKVLVLITTNEKLERMHPAVTRDGRCVASIKFDKLTEAESKTWAKINNMDTSLVTKGEHPVSELYAKKSASSVIKNEEKEKKESSLGFKFPVREEKNTQEISSM